MDIRLARSGLVLAVGLVLAGCGAYDSMRESIMGKEIPLACPRVSLLPAGASLTRFLPGPGRDIIDIVYQVEIRDILRSCEYDIDDDTKAGTVTVELFVLVGAERGAADRERKAAFQYFVAVTDSNKTVLNKNAFDATVTFPGNRSKVDWTDKGVKLNIPLKAGQNGSNFEIIVGFQMSREEMEFNSRRRARPQ